jgi:hypothetical protein
MENKHTPGPWSWERPSRIMLDAGAQRYALYTGTELKPNWVAEIHFSKHDIINKGMEENAANARLIAAAPELLEALQEMLNRYAPYGSGDSNARAEAINKATSAISKARG